MWQGCGPSSLSRRWSPGSLGGTRPGLTHGPGRCPFSLPPCRPVGAPSSAHSGLSLLLTASRGAESHVRPGLRPEGRPWLGLRVTKDCGYLRHNIWTCTDVRACLRVHLCAGTTKPLSGQFWLENTTWTILMNLELR